MLSKKQYEDVIMILVILQQHEDNTIVRLAKSLYNALEKEYWQSKIEKDITY